MRSTFLLVRTFTLTAAVAAVACDGGGPIESPGSTPTPATDPIAAQGPERVIVTNTAVNPVKTEAMGTTTVGGTVSANQAGTWDVRVNNATLAVEGAVQVTGGAIAASQAGVWGVTVTEPVAIAPGASVAVSSLPPVTLAGTPEVNATITGTPTVNATITGTPTVTIAGATQAIPVTGAVEVANLPAVQEVSGTVAIAARATRWGTLQLTQPGGIELPSGLVLTDLTLTLLVPGGDCKVALYEFVEHGSGVRFLQAWPLSDEHPVAELHLQTGIAARGLSSLDEQLAVALFNGSCTAHVLWSGYVP